MTKDYSRMTGIGISGFTNHRILSNKNLLGMLNIKYIFAADSNKTISRIDSTILHTEDRVSDAAILHTDKVSDMIILKNNAKLQKAWLVKKITSASSDKILQNIHNNKNFNYLNEAFISKKGIIINEYENFDDNHTISFESIKNGNIKMQVSSDSGGYLVLSESYYPGWKAYVDGVETVVYRTNNILNGIVVPRGIHAVEFNFLPNSWVYSFIFSLASLFLFVWLLISRKYLNSKGNI